ncbi:hypothetical protein TELCIR_16609 [Teladorsagia circumcincta]|uniref:Peptidase M12A domain-containing protein n=1 Tax=Teladorsagia circumcincta TaxID=45464 RepID=A0A2G9TWM6_TELCI|nr:hypothetical protein TELCIR_16609 [Teladorsagia circumcincta]
MIREIATFSDVHHGANDDYGAVQTIMEAFFQSLADPQPTTAAQDPTRAAALFQPQYDGTELGPNRPLTNQLFESDMVLTVEQMKGCYSSVGRTGGSQMISIGYGCEDKATKTTLSGPQLSVVDGAPEGGTYGVLLREAFKESN